MANKISCPQCDQKFKTETGRDWHIDHIHSLPKQSTGLISQTGIRSLATGKVTAKNTDQAGLRSDLLELNRHVDDIEEMAKCRLDISLRRAAWLSERIERLEENSLNIHKTESK